MRVAFLALHFLEYAVELVERLSSHADIMFIYSSVSARAELGADYNDRIRALSLRSVEVEFNRTLAGAVELANEIVSTVVEFCPDIIHLQEVGSAFVSMALLRLRRYPIVLTIHDPSPHSGEGVRSIGGLAYQVAIRVNRRLSTVVISHGELLARQIEGLYPRLIGRVFSVPHGPLGGPPDAVAPDSGRFLFFGRMHAYKGLGTFIAAVERLHRQGMDITGVIAGRGDDLERHRSEIEGHPAFEIHERFIDRSELPEIFGRSFAVVLPYKDGTQSGVAAMALGYGRAIIASRVGALEEMIRDGENGILIEKSDDKLLAAAMLHLSVTPNDARRMGQRSFELGQNELSWERNATITLDAYTVAMKGHGNGYGSF